MFVSVFRRPSLQRYFCFWVPNTHAASSSALRNVGAKRVKGNEGLNMRMTKAKKKNINTKIAQIRRRWEFIYEFAEVETHEAFAMSLYSL